MKNLGISLWEFRCLKIVFFLSGRLFYFLSILVEEKLFELVSHSLSSSKASWNIKYWCTNRKVYLNDYLQVVKFLEKGRATCLALHTVCEFDITNFAQEFYLGVNGLHLKFQVLRWFIKVNVSVLVQILAMWLFCRLFLSTSRWSCRSRSCQSLRSFIRSEPLFPSAWLLNLYLYDFKCIYVLFPVEKTVTQFWNCTHPVWPATYNAVALSVSYLPLKN